MKLDRNSIQFGTTFGIDREQLEDARIDVKARRREQAAVDFGMKIHEKKPWVEQQDGDVTVSTLEIFVFTRDELHELVRRAKLGLELFDEL